MGRPMRGRMLIMLASLLGALTSIVSGCASAHGATSRATPAVLPTTPPPSATTVLPSDVTISCPASAPGAFLSCQYAGPDNTQMAFYLYVPRGYTGSDSGQQYPLVLILQGGGERA